MESHQQSFIEFIIKHQALRFGDFTLKSGKKSPYFFNIGLFNTGAAIKHLGEYYASAIAKLEFDVLFGPAYKGIPLSLATSIALATHYNRDIPYAFNRKEKKTHGERDWFVGTPLHGNVVLIDDVISAGTAIREVKPLIEEAGASLKTVIIALDRCERYNSGQSSLSNCQQLESEFDISITSIITIYEVLEYLTQHAEFQKEADIMRNYLEEYGAPKSNTN